MKTVTIEAGTIRYQDEGSGRTILFLHGALSNGHTWRKVIPLLSGEFRCIVPDLPLGGHAIPLTHQADLSPQGIALMLEQFIEALKLDNIVLVGNDTGGAYGQVFSLRYPHRISHLVLCNTDAFEVFPPKAFSSLKAGVHIPGFMWLMAQLFRCKALLTTPLVLGLLSHRLTKHEASALYIPSFIRQRGIRADFRKVVKGWSPQITLQAAEQLRQFRQPVLVLWGADDDKLFPQQLGLRVHAIFQQSTFKLIQNARTYVQEDQPEAFAIALAHWLNTPSSELVEQVIPPELNTVL